MKTNVKPVETKGKPMETNENWWKAMENQMYKTMRKFCRAVLKPCKVLSDVINKINLNNKKKLLQKREENLWHKN